VGRDGRRPDLDPSPLAAGREDRDDRLAHDLAPPRPCEGRLVEAHGVPVRPRDREPGQQRGGDALGRRAVEVEQVGRGAVHRRDLAAGRHEQHPTPSASLEFNQSGSEVWVSDWATNGAVIVLDSTTLTELRRFTGLQTPTGKFNVYNTTRDVY
jgi:hypothetical protein